MKPYKPCTNHPDRESDSFCHFCRKDFCLECLKKGDGYYYCKNPDCSRTKKSSKNEKEISAQKDEKEIVIAAKFPTEAEAHLALAKLSSRGVRSFVSENRIFSSLSIGASPVGGAKLWVKSGDLKKILKILETQVPHCQKHEKRKSTGVCSFCRKAFCSQCLDKKSWNAHCRNPKCVKAFKAEMVGSKKQSLESGPAPAPKWGFGWAVLFFFAIKGIYLVPWVLTGSYLNRWGLLLSQNLSFWIKILSATGAVFFTLFLLTRIKSLGWLESLRFLGYKKPNGRQLLTALFLLVPIGAGHLSYYWGCLQQGGMIEPRSHAASFFLSYFILGVGVYEETIYRGFFFQLLRPGRSFFSAAALSGILWSTAHLGHLIPLGFPNDESFHSVICTMLFVFLDSFASAYVFERGGNVIWGWMLVHLGIDTSLFWHVDGIVFHASDLPRTSSWAWSFLTTILTFPIANWLMPQADKKISKKTASILEKLRIKKARLENAVSAKWGLICLPFILVFYLWLSLYLRSAEKQSEEALDRLYRFAIKHRPRCVVFYNDWAEAKEMQGRYDEEIEKCSKTLEIDPKNAEAYLNWGLALKKKKEDEEACSKFEKTVELDPRNVQGLLWCGYMLERLNKGEEALQKYRAVLQLKPYETYFAEYAQERIDKINKTKPN
jgi:membrane protease YdiL (CAAX protease family)